MTRRLILPLAVLVLLAAGGLTLLLGGSSSKVVTATFASTTSLNPGAKVKVLGVDVGTVTSIKPVGTSVRVTMRYDESVKLPSDVHAVIVPPSIVGDRFVQLGPAYRQGPVLADHAQITLAHTGVPLELDQVYRGVDDLSQALGPHGANRTGALSDLITASAQNLRGNGQLLNDTIRNLAGALGTLASGSSNYTGTLANTSKVTRTLAGNDRTITRLVENLVRVTVELNGQREDIKGAVNDLDDALGTVDAFTRRNSGSITRTVDNLRTISRVLAAHRTDLEQAINVAPVGLGNLMNIIVPTNWDINQPLASSPDGRTSSLNLRSALTSNLDTQLGQVLTGVCNRLSAAQAVQLAPFCTALIATGGNLGSLLSSTLGAGS